MTSLREITSHVENIQFGRMGTPEDETRLRASSRCFDEILVSWRWMPTFLCFRAKLKGQELSEQLKFHTKSGLQLQKKGVRKKEQWFTFKYLHVTILKTPYILYTYIFPGRRYPWLSFNAIRMKVDFRQVEPKGGWSWSGGGTFVLCKKFDF